MSAISLKSITGITSITTPAGVDNQLTLHNNNTSEAVKLDVAGNIHINNQLAVAGVTTYSDDVKFTGNNYNVLWDKSDNSLKFDALAKIKLNDSFQFYHNTNGVLHNTSGTTYIYGSGSGAISLMAQPGSQNISCNPNANTSLYYANDQKLYTVSDGVYINDNLGIKDSIQHVLDTNTKIRSPANDTISFETSGTERLRITSAGHLSFGASDITKTWSLGKAMHFGVSENALWGEGDYAFHMMQNAYYNGGWKRTHADEATLYSSADGKHLFYTAASGSADSAISWSERFRIASNGNVGINRSDPNQRLNVSGNIELNAYDSAGGSGGYYTSKGLIIGNAYDAGKTGLTDDRNSIIWSERGLDLDIATNDTLRMKIKSDGNITQTIGSDGDGFTITAGDMKPMLTGNSNRSAHNNTIFGISGKWNNTEIGRIAFEAGPDTTNKDDGKIRLYTRPSGGSLTQRIDIADDGKITVAAGSDIRFTNGTWTGEVAGKIQHNSNNLYIQGGTGGIRFRHASSGTNQFSMTNGGNFEITDGDLVVASGHGIDFGATANGGSGTPSELLDDYEEGSFAPEVDNLSSGYGSGTFYNRTCKYTKVGNMVTCWGHLQWWGNAVTSGNDNLELTITGFPFEVDGVGYRGTCGGSVVAQSWRYSGSGWNNYHTDSDNVQVGINASEQIRFFVYTHNSIVGTVTQKSINGYSPNIEFCFQVRVTSYK